MQEFFKPTVPAAGEEYHRLKMQHDNRSYLQPGRTEVTQRKILLAGLMLLPVSAAGARQSPGSADSLGLAAMHQQALARDPRQRQFTLLARQTDLRLRTLSARRLPSFSAEARAQYQSDVFDAGGLPPGIAFPSPSHDSYDTRLSVEQPLYDPAISPRQRRERARLAESEAGVHSELFVLREEVNEAFFAAALLGERDAIIGATIQELEKRLDEARVRVREGVALPSDTATIRATLLERRQDQSEIRSDRRAALGRLSELIRRAIPDTERLALPDLASAAVEARRDLAQVRQRPEYEEFARARERLVSEEGVEAAEQKPRVAAFGRLGYGRPGINPVNDAFDSYYVVGVEMTWSPFNWGSTGREREALRLQGDIVAAEEAAFSGRLTRATEADLATMDRLDSTLVLDDQIVALRERVERETGLRFREGEVTASEYLDRNTDVLEARLARATHQIEQVRARARFLTTLGLEIR
jgi:outer membrane protein TolC